MNTIVWFRRDLRVHDLPSLVAAASRGGEVTPLFVLDDRLLAASSPNRAWFLAGSLAALDASLRALGSRLLVRRGDPREVVAQVALEAAAGEVHLSRDYAPFGRARDAAVAAALDHHGIAFRRHPGILVHEPEELVADGRHLTVYSPFARRWATLPHREPVAAPRRLPAPPDGLQSDGLPDPAVLRPSLDPALAPEPGEVAARRRLERWLAGGIDGYAETRDRLDLAGTSRLSQDLRFGLVSPAEVVARAAGPGEGRRRFLAELAWRDFYAHLLWHEPRLLREAFDPAFDDIGAAGDGAAAAVDAWTGGMTGYPVVDAAMRQLVATGWMPNRARMVAASFLAKDLLIDRRVGERHFFAHLLDGEPASNNGGWQWAASTGADPQPYVRVFNPVLQGERFDPTGAYVRRWVPELSRLPDAFLHAPWTMPRSVEDSLGVRIGRDYPAPIVDHASARIRAIEAYRERRRTS